jgi:phage gp37-like protein
MSLLALESALVERLKARLPAGVHVLSAADLAGVAEGSQPTPAVHVVYQGYRVSESRPDGRAARIEQTWLVVVAVRNVRDARSGGAARADAGDLAESVIAAIMGWQPEGTSSPLKLTTAPRAGYAAGHIYMPLGFACETTVKGLP